jgi:hypothetical protein
MLQYNYSSMIDANMYQNLNYKYIFIKALYMLRILRF